MEAKTCGTTATVGIISRLIAETRCARCGAFAIANPSEFSGKSQTGCVLCQRCRIQLLVEGTGHCSTCVERVTAFYRSSKLFTFLEPNSMLRRSGLFSELPDLLRHNPDPWVCPTCLLPGLTLSNAIDHFRCLTCHAPMTHCRPGEDKHRCDPIGTRRLEEVANLVDRMNLMNLSSS